MLSDILLELSQNSHARKLIHSLGLPFPMPQKLHRASTPWQPLILDDQNIVVGAASGGTLAHVIAQTIPRAGGHALVMGEESLFAAFVTPGTHHGRPAQHLQMNQFFGTRLALPIHGLVFDASGIRETEALRELYDFFHPLVPQLSEWGRIVVLGRSPTRLHDTTEAMVAQSALMGFIRSLAKEIGKYGSTAQLMYVDEGAEDRVEGALRFILSKHSAFITGQVLHINTQIVTEELPAWERPLEGKVALVTGAAQGIGAATAKRLASEGAHVVCLDRPSEEDSLSNIAQELHGTPLLIDLGHSDAPTTILKELQHHYDGVDIVVQNAGITRDKTLARMSGESWDQTIDINLSAVVRLSQELLSQGLRDDGRMIYLSSLAGIAGNFGQTNYATAKAGVLGLVSHLAAKVEHRGITVNAIAPGLIETRLTATIPFMLRELGRRLSSLGQGGIPQDVAEAIVFFASAASSGLTGSVLRVCGGSFLGA